TTGNGNAGNVEIQVGRLRMTGGALITSDSGSVSVEGAVTAGSGRGGTVTVTATDEMFIAGRDSTGFLQSGLFSQAGVGNAGRVVVSTPRLIMADGGLIGADTGGDGRAGDVVVQVGSLELTGGAQINSRSGIELGGRLFVGAGAGGTVTL